MPRLFDATIGAVLVDGVDVRELDPDLLWSKVGYVPQKPFLFSGTVASNLRFGRPDATDDELWEALEIAQAADFVLAMPDGIDSEIAQGGTNVSGGQRQRLSIARALVVEPEIYVFDDSFSALDLGTDARLRAALAPHTEQAAVLLVAQRVSTIADADQILVIDDGEIVGRGTHGELIADCPTYAEIVDSQLGEGASHERSQRRTGSRRQDRPRSPHHDRPGRSTRRVRARRRRRHPHREARTSASRCVASATPRHRDAPLVGVGC